MIRIQTYHSSFVQLTANDTQGEQLCVCECCSMAEMYYKVKPTHNYCKGAE